MSASRGSDIPSWFENRAAHRKEVRANLNKIEDTRLKLEAVSVGVAPLAAGGDENDPDALAQKGRAILAEIGKIDQELTTIDPQRQAQRTALDSEVAKLQRTAEQRARQQAEATRQKVEESRKAWATRRQSLKKWVIGIAVIAALIYWYSC